MNITSEWDALNLCSRNLMLEDKFVKTNKPTTLKAWVGSEAKSTHDFWLADMSPHF